MAGTPIKKARREAEEAAAANPPVRADPIIVLVLVMIALAYFTWHFALPFLWGLL